MFHRRNSQWFRDVHDAAACFGSLWFMRQIAIRISSVTRRLTSHWTYTTCCGAVARVISGCSINRELKTIFEVSWILGVCLNFSGDAQELYNDLRRHFQWFGACTSFIGHVYSGSKVMRSFHKFGIVGQNLLVSHLKHMFSLFKQSCSML